VRVLGPTQTGPELYAPRRNDFMDDVENSVPELAPGADIQWFIARLRRLTGARNRPENSG
jgi:hypothetical protein